MLSNETVSDHLNNDLSSLMKTVEQTLHQIAVQSLMGHGNRKYRTFIAVKCHHGGRDMLMINAHAAEIPTLLRPRSANPESNDPLLGKNRPIIPDHVKRIKEYIVNRAKSQPGKWILGTLTANVHPEEIKLHHITGDLYIVNIPYDVALEITDGQHRKQAITELIESGGYERDLIRDQSFPITLVLEGELQQCQTDFRDMAQTASLPNSLLVAYGGGGRDGIAQRVVENVGMFRNKTQKIKMTPGSKSGHIYTLNYIAQLVGCAFENDPKAELLNYDIEESAKVLSSCLNEFFVACPQTNSIAAEETLHRDAATEFRENCLLGVSVGLEILGRLLNVVYDKSTRSFDQKRVSQLTKLNWLRNNDFWQGTVVRKVENDDGSFSYKISTGKTSVDDAVKDVKKYLGW